MFLGCLVLEYISHDLVFKHVGLFYGNTYSVSWSYKSRTSTLLPVWHLLHLLSIRQWSRKAYLLLPRQISGKDNDISDITSRYFNRGVFFHSKSKLETHFNLHFTLPQTQSWQEYRVARKLASCVISCLRGEQLSMTSMHKLPKLGKSIGKNVHSNSHSVTSLPISTIFIPSNAASLSLLLYQKYEPGL